MSVSALISSSSSSSNNSMPPAAAKPIEELWSWLAMHILSSIPHAHEFKSLHASFKSMQALRPRNLFKAGIVESAYMLQMTAKEIESAQNYKTLGAIVDAGKRRILNFAQILSQYTEDADTSLMIRGTKEKLNLSADKLMMVFQKCYREEFFTEKSDIYKGKAITIESEQITFLTKIDEQRNLNVIFYSARTFIAKGSHGQVFKVLNISLAKFQMLKLVCRENHKGSVPFDDRVKIAQHEAKMLAYVHKDREQKEFQSAPTAVFELKGFNQQLESYCFSSTLYSENLFNFLSRENLGHSHRLTICDIIVNHWKKLREQKILHLDLGLENFLIDRREDGRICPILADFGASRTEDPSCPRYNNFRCYSFTREEYRELKTLKFPELQEAEKRIEMAQLGAILYHVLGNSKESRELIYQYPYPLDNSLFALKGACYNWRYLHRVGYSSEVVQLIGRMLTQKRESRISQEEFCKAWQTLREKNEREVKEAEHITISPRTIWGETASMLLTYMKPADYPMFYGHFSIPPTKRQISHPLLPFIKPIFSLYHEKPRHFFLRSKITKQETILTTAHLIHLSHQLLHLTEEDMKILHERYLDLCVDGLDVRVYIRDNKLELVLLTGSIPSASDGHSQTILAFNIARGT